jgi:thymidylate synthase
MNKLDKDYQALLKDIIYSGRDKEDRTGTGTMSVFGRQIRHKMADGFPLLTTKKMAFRTMVTELLWFLKGDTNIKYLVDNGCNIWNGDAYKAYEKYAMANSYGVDILSMEEFIERIKTDDEFAKKWGELGPIYGAQWRHWLVKDETEYDGEYVWVDQIKNLINDLKINPDSRRLMVNAWNVGELDQMVLPPCHYGFQVYTRELLPNERKVEWAKSLGKDVSYAYNLTQEDLDAKGFPRRTISLMWNQRSVDTFLGLPFNIASYGLLLLILAKEVNMLPDELIGNLGDVHLYKNHIAQAKEQMKREPLELPEVRLRNYETLDELLNTTDSMSMIQLWRYDSHPTIKAPLSN